MKHLVNKGQLIGGVVINNSLEKEFSFRDLTGEVELKIDEARGSDLSMTSLVSQFLEAVIVNLGGVQPDKNLVEKLCIADRQILVRHFAKFNNTDQIWISSNCSSCGERFDFQICQSELPFKPAGDGFPYFSINTSQGLLKFRVPTAKDILDVSDSYDEDVSIRNLLKSCLLSTESACIQLLNKSDLELIEGEMERISPEVTEMVSVRCPDCKHTQEIRIDPYLCLDEFNTTIYQEVNKIAQTYHWSEREILSLSRTRRKKYLDMIN